MLTGDLGITWQSTPGELPPGVLDNFDFAALAVRGPKCWVAGSPGTRVLHTDDAGKNWTAFPTGQNVPLHAITFVDDLHGWAVGALGTILATDDGGRTWRRQRRAAPGPPCWASSAGPRTCRWNCLPNSPATTATWAWSNWSIATIRRDPPRQAAAGRSPARGPRRGSAAAMRDPTWRFPLRHRAGLDAEADRRAVGSGQRRPRTRETPGPSGPADPPLAARGDRHPRCRPDRRRSPSPPDQPGRRSKRSCRPPIRPATSTRSPARAGAVAGEEGLRSRPLRRSGRQAQRGADRRTPGPLARRGGGRRAGACWRPDSPRAPTCSPFGSCSTGSTTKASQDDFFDRIVLATGRRGTTRRHEAARRRTPLARNNSPANAATCRPSCDAPKAPRWADANSWPTPAN